MKSAIFRAASGRGGFRRLLLCCLGVLGGLALVTGACSDLLKVNDPDVVTPGNLGDPSVLPTIRAGAVGDFTLAYSGSGADGSGGIEGVIMTGGLLSDEWVNSETFPNRILDDARQVAINDATMQTVFRNVQRARRATQFAADRYRGLAPDTLLEPGFAEMLGLEGFMWVFMAENYCSGVPVSHANEDGSLVFGDPLTTTELLDTALARFNGAIATTTNTTMIRLATVGKARAQLDLGQFAAAATTAGAVPLTFAYTVQHTENYCSGVPVSHANEDGSLVFGDPLTTTQLLDTALARFNGAIATTTSTTMIRLATVGKARAQLDLGQFAAAATTAGAVPQTFAYTVQHTENTARENNGIFNANVINERYSVADKEGINGLPWRSVVDPRTPFERTPASDVGFDNATPQYDALRYGDRKASVTVATGAEAGLIVAEAALQAGDTGAGGGFLTALNALRAAPPAYFNSTRAGVLPVAPMAALTTADIAAAGGAVNLLFNERGRWLWLTGHRLSDLRRLVRQYGRAANSVFPTGAYFKVQVPTYGNDVNFPIPIDELNNPNFTQCIDRNP